MPTRARRRSFAPRVDSLESRQLLSTTAADALVVRDPDPADGLLLRFRDGTTSQAESAILNTIHGEVLTSYPDGPSLVELPPSANVDAVLGWLASMPSVRYADPDGTIQVQGDPSALTVSATATTSAAPSTLNDPYFTQQWGLNNPTGNGVDIDAEQAWTITTGSPSTIIAVIDSGIDLANPEFAGRIWTNPQANAPGDATPGDVNGWNFIDNTPDVQDDNGHGTHVSGILGADANNGIGVVGVNWQAQIMPLKFIDQFGNGSVDDAVRAIYYAVDHGANVINASWGGGQNDQALTDAIAYAGTHNVVFVTAAGNEGVNNAVVRSYPADDRLSNVISVAAIDESGRLASFSNFGATTVDLAAPGVNIVSTVPGGYATYSGTSMATPYVTGVVSLLQGLHPEYTAAQVVQIIDGTTKPLNSVKNKTITGGMLDAYTAVTEQSTTSPSSTLLKKRKALELAAAKKAKALKVKAPQVTKVKAASIRPHEGNPREILVVTRPDDASGE